MGTTPLQAADHVARAEDVVGDYLVEEVNSRLRAFGDRWSGGRVDAERIREALAEIPPGRVPTDVRGRASALATWIVTGQAPGLAGGASSGAAASGARTGIEVDFARRERREPAAGQENKFDQFVTAVAQAAVRRYGEGAAVVVVNVEGGGNGGLFSRARDVGLQRANAVVSRLTPLVGQRLRAAGVPAQMVHFNASSRGSEERAPDIAAEAHAERQRRVRVWTDAVLPAGRAEGDAERSVPSASAGAGSSTAGGTATAVPAEAAVASPQGHEAAPPRLESVEDWVSVWASSGFRAAMRLTEDALATLPASDRAAVLRTALSAIEEWQEGETPDNNPRWQAVDALRLRLQDTLEGLQPGVSGIEPMPVAVADDADHRAQRMVASARDLEMVRHLINSDTADPFAAELARVEHELAVHGGAAGVDVQVRRRANLIEDRAILHEMRPRTDWSALRPSQIAAMVVAERRGRAASRVDRQELIEQLRVARYTYAWAAGYPIAGDNINGLIDQVLAYMRQRMNLTINVNLSKLGADGRTVLDLMLSDRQVFFKNTWVTEPNVRKYINDRGTAEEFLGYSASVKRNREYGGGIYPENNVKRRFKFSPDEQDRIDLPKYTALMSPIRVEGIPDFGSAVFYLKRDLLGRATFTPWDSFYDGSQGARGVTGPDGMVSLLAHGVQSVVRLVFAEATNFAYDEEFRLLRDSGELANEIGNDDFFEAQIHGDLTWHDLDRIVLLQGGNYEEDRTGERDALQQFAVNNGFGFHVEIRQMP
jgi:hypothetical protein